MRTKAQLIEEILSIKAVDTKSNLMKLTLAKLESLLSELEEEMVSDSKESTQTLESNPVAPQVDMQSLMEMMKRELMPELLEQARKEVEAEVKAELEEKAEISVPRSPKKIEVDLDAMIPVMNITSGTLIYINKKTGAEWVWDEYGVIDYMEYRELLGMRSGDKRFLNEPFILVMDDEAVEKLGLTKMYDNMKSPDQIDEIFNLSQAAFENVVENSPKGIKHLIATRARKLYEMGELDSARKIKYINERFQTDIGQRG